MHETAKCPREKELLGAAIKENNRLKNKEK
jgi:hypothetical protein